MNATELRKATQVHVNKIDLSDAETAIESLAEQISTVSERHYGRTDLDLARGTARFSVQWARSGFPQVSLDHKLAASLMCTDIPPYDSDVEIAMPWPGFVVIVPDNLLRIGGDSLSLLMVAPAGTLNIQPFSVLDSGMFQAPHLVEMYRRLVVGVAIELDQPRHRDVIALGPPNYDRRKHKEPIAWTFVLRRDVHVDCRAAVQEYVVRGNGKSPTVQSIVRGHHKRQAYGPDRSLRKWIHIEPYWRGPGDAPIAVRSHIL